MIDTLREILTRNYTALGWKLDRLDKLTRTGSDLQYLSGKIVCPCGGQEYFLMNIPEGDIDVSRLAADILMMTCSRAHLQQDVNDGTLPPFNIDKHVFKGVLL